ncbi:thiamine pyrophosphate-requiring protein [Neorhizobium sp. Rsf11]|uniref:Thiamine pyrophosphate-requiring protein n=2 Tax=Neorhizobium TaxID=1525371 RepID=A0ABV0M681_9HYPH|nr:thiamine pyrophosphate-requiring protein [Neorhizobium petrolearium]MCC2613959.1 thiamine pyrophosphate-requiring protein [Neorhizobium petrolearium]WGI71480.1 thiamine pyrophosphate-requiring protein [Neorhizobium petrolearium]
MTDAKATSRADTITAGGAILARLKAVGVDYIFANSGTDFPPIIEGLAEASAKQIPLPKAIVIPHENAAMGMAHGYYLATGKAQAVMAHTNVGLANCAIGAINAATEHIPMLIFSGRTPVVEKGRLGARTVPISWGQEMRDQAAMIRETVKWDYELRFPEQAVDIIDRAHAIANSTPRGPVYLSLPREVLCEQCPSDELDNPGRIAPAIAAPRSADIEAAARLLSEAKRPLIISQRGAGSQEGFETLSKLALDWGIPVCQYWAIQLGVPTDHPMAVGVDPAKWLAEADLVLVIDCLAPWSPDIHPLGEGCKVVHIGQDPLYSRFPVRNFPSDVALTGDTAEVILQLEKAAGVYLDATSKERSTRRASVEKASSKRRAEVQAQAKAGNGELMTKAFVSFTLSKAIEGRKATVLSELGAPLEPLTLRDHGSWYQEPHSGGLGWSFPTGLGMKLADPGKLVIATMGDGSYMFSNPVACHQIAEAMEIPLLVLVLNNVEWGAVRQSVLGVYPDGFAAKTNSMPLVSLVPTPDFTQVAAASRAWTAKVERAEDLGAVLEAAIEHVTVKKTQALVEIRIAP